jgi:hypothetical protein
MAKDEPQSYGSQSDWLTGKTGETVNRTKGHPTTQTGDFYESRIEGERNAPDQGGNLSPGETAETGEPADARELAADEQPVQKVTSAPGGARRGGAFKERDYE